jgi:hypothetical protein
MLQITVLSISDMKTISLKATLFAQQAIHKVIGYDPIMVTPISAAIVQAAFNDKEFRAALLEEKGGKLHNIQELTAQAIRLAREVVRETRANIYKKDIFVGDFAAMYITEAVKNRMIYLTLLEWEAKPESKWPLKEYTPGVTI